VDAEVKAGLLELIDHAVAGGWSTARACRVFELQPDRAGRWRRRRDTGDGLDDATPGPAEPLHALLDWERAAIIELFDEWSEVDRSHRKLAHRGSRLEKVFVSESSVLRVLRAENLVLPARPPREPVPARPWPAWVEYRPCQVWGHDFTTFGRAGRDALAVLDLVSRKWLATLTVPHQRGESEHVQALYTRALETDGRCRRLVTDAVSEVEGAWTWPTTTAPRIPRTRRSRRRWTVCGPAIRTRRRLRRQRGAGWRLMVRPARSISGSCRTSCGTGCR
jgi:putative transposase